MTDDEHVTHAFACGAADAWMEAMPLVYAVNSAAMQLPLLQNQTIWSHFVYRCPLANSKRTAAVALTI